VGNSSFGVCSGPPLLTQLLNLSGFGGFLFIAGKVTRWVTTLIRHIHVEDVVVSTGSRPSAVALRGDSGLAASSWSGDENSGLDTPPDRV